jgi:hypothetical protein
MYFHHNWNKWEDHLNRTFPAVKDHVLLERANDLDDAATEIKSTLDKDKISNIVGLIPEDWLQEESNVLTPSQMKAAYVDFLMSKLNKIELLAKEAQDAR